MIAVAAAAQLPASFWGPGLKPHVKELPCFVALGVLPAPWCAQIFLCSAHEVPRGLYEVHCSKIVQQQLLRHPPHTRTTVCERLSGLASLCVLQADMKAAEAATCALPSLFCLSVCCVLHKIVFKRCCKD